MQNASFQEKGGCIIYGVHQYKHDMQMERKEVGGTPKPQFFCRILYTVLTAFQLLGSGGAFRPPGYL
eukprot:scaffold748_cov35-Cyclotella_meneghiniana.AAC.3